MAMELMRANFVVPSASELTQNKVIMHEHEDFDQVLMTMNNQLKAEALNL